MQILFFLQKVIQRTMIISSNSLGKSNNFINSNILLRTDGFRKIVKGFNSTKKIIQNDNIKSHSNLHTSAGLRRVTKQYNIGFRENESKLDGEGGEMVKSRKIMTAEKYQHKVCGSKRKAEKNQARQSELFKYEKEQIVNFKKICKLLNI